MLNRQEWFFSLIGENGEETPCTGLLSVDNEEAGIRYILYTDDSLDEEGYLVVHAGWYSLKEEAVRLNPVETEKEYRALDVLLRAAIRICRGKNRITV